jgi:hypothetical protein
MSDVTSEIAIRDRGSASEYGSGIRPPVHDVSTAAEVTAARTGAIAVRHRLGIGRRGPAQRWRGHALRQLGPALRDSPTHR